ncbi:hypothetical protein [Ramlibacter sp.]|uniref:hypothetical protein n=1 Tax=Ramlibacter sp. TaxID=1917967 RepID=UPI0035AFDB10
MPDFTKPERRVLREIAGGVYEAEAGKLLARLEAKFRAWREGGIGAADLIGEIHQFHQHDSRELWSAYRFLREADIVARGVAMGFIPEDRVPGELLVKLMPMISFYRGGPDESAVEEDAG